MHTSRSRALRLGHHGTPRTISSIKGRASPATALVCAPASLTSEDDVVEAVKGAGTRAEDKGSVAQKRDVIEAEVPYRSVDHAVRAEGHESTDDRSSEDVVPVVIFVDAEGTTNQAGA